MSLDGVDGGSEHLTGAGLAVANQLRQPQSVVLVILGKGHGRNGNASWVCVRGSRRSSRLRSQSTSTPAEGRDSPRTSNFDLEPFRPTTMGDTCLCCRSLSTIVGEAFAAEGIDPSYGGVVVSQRPELAQFQANGAMAAAKVAGIGSTRTRSEDCRPTGRRIRSWPSRR